MIVDVKEAYVYAPSTRKVCVQIPDEDCEEGDEGRCGLLMESFYGTRDAALNWSMAYIGVLERLGFVNWGLRPPARSSTRTARLKRPCTGTIL